VLTVEVRHTDLVARYGGEEFVLVLVETGAEAAAAVCEKVRARDRDARFHRHRARARGHGQHRLVRRHHAPGPDAMLGAADAALYRAKAAGRNRTAGGKASG
jgi:diguanylate cyclase